MAGSVVAGMLGLLTILVVVPEGAPPTALDTWVFDVTNEWTQQAPWAVDIAAAIGVATDVVASTAFAVIVTLALAARRMWRFALFMVGCGLVGVAMVELVKTTVGRLRPPGAQEFIESGLDRSFPSGHASVGVYVYVALAVLVVVVAARSGRTVGVWLGGALFVFGIVIGLSRIVLGVHWSTDVIAGWTLSSLVVLVATIVIAPQRASAQMEPSDSP